MLARTGLQTRPGAGRLGLADQGEDETEGAGKVRGGRHRPGIAVGIDRRRVVQAVSGGAQGVQRERLPRGSVVLGDERAEPLSHDHRPPPIGFADRATEG